MQSSVNAQFMSAHVPGVMALTAQHGVEVLCTAYDDALVVKAGVDGILVLMPEDLNFGSYTETIGRIIGFAAMIADARGERQVAVFDY